MNAAEVEWLLATGFVTACVCAAIAGAATGRSWLALPSLIPATAGLFIRATDQQITQPDQGWIVALSIALVTLAVVSGGPLTMWVLKLTDRSTTPNTHSSDSDILRGGATIGYLERIAVVAAVALRQTDIVLAVIAIKGLGRFNELGTSEARERFIIGTLVSLLWAGLIAGLVWPPA